MADGSTGTVTRADLCEAVHAALGLSKTECARLVDSMLHEMCAALSRGEDVKLSGFGTFHLRDKVMRVGRDFQRGDRVAIAPRRVMSFRACQAVRARVAGAPAGADDAGRAEDTRTVDPAATGVVVGDAAYRRSAAAPGMAGARGA